MKKISLLLACVVLFTGCGRLKKVVGNGNVVTQTLDVRDFNEIFTDLPAEINYTQDENYSCSVTLDENLFQYLSIEVNDGRLVMTLRNIHVSFLKTTKFVVDIAAPTLTDVESAGSGDVNFINDFEGNNMRLNISGSGNINTKKMALKSLNGDFSGSGDINMKNVLADDNVELKQSGSGDCVVNHMATPRMNIVSSGSGSLDVQAGEITDLNVKDSGSGAISVFENLITVDATVSGSGSVTLGQISERLMYYLTGSGNLSYSGDCETSGSCTGSGRLIKR